MAKHATIAKGLTTALLVLFLLATAAGFVLLRGATDRIVRNQAPGASMMLVKGFRNFQDSNAPKTRGM